jgi:predicted AAA+ superfamily ATPase
MVEYKRMLDLTTEASKKSLFLFGPRQTGKTFLLKKQFPNAICYNLLQSDIFFRLSKHPELLREELIAKRDLISGPVIIDEVQKLPFLLDEVHNLIESLRITFVLTGSSARKLKRGGANLLGGRARTRHLYSLVYPEIPDFDLVRVTNFGTIPSIYLSDEPKQDLLSYCGSYLKEEIQSESIVRRIDNFSRFLGVAALINAELVNYHSVARDAEVAVKTVREYFEILQDTLIGTLVEPFRNTVSRKAVSMAKFFFFDIGVCNILAQRSGIIPGNELFGKSFEHLIFLEINAYLDYTRDDRQLTFWRDQAKNEVDFLIGDEIGIEVKATTMVQDKHLKGLRILSEEIELKHKIVVSLDLAPRKTDDILILPWKDFLTRLWAGEW